MKSICKAPTVKFFPPRKSFAAGSKCATVISSGNMFFLLDVHLSGFHAVFRWKVFRELVQWFGMFSNPHNDLRKSFCSSCLMWEVGLKSLTLSNMLLLLKPCTFIEKFSHFQEYLSSDSRQTASIIIIWQTNVKYEVVLCNIYVHANYEKWIASMKVASRKQAGELHFNMLCSLSLLILQQVILHNKWFCFIPRLPEFVCELLKYFKSILFRKFLSC